MRTAAGELPLEMVPVCSEFDFESGQRVCRCMGPLDQEVCQGRRQGGCQGVGQGCREVSACIRECVGGRSASGLLLHNQSHWHAKAVKDNVSPGLGGGTWVWGAGTGSQGGCPFCIIALICCCIGCCRCGSAAQASPARWLHVSRSSSSVGGCSRGCRWCSCRCFAGLAAGAGTPASPGGDRPGSTGLGCGALCMHRPRGLYPVSGQGNYTAMSCA